jgi:hypothetical protein
MNRRTVPRLMSVLLRNMWEHRTLILHAGAERGSGDRRRSYERNSSFVRMHRNRFGAGRSPLGICCKRRSHYRRQRANSVRAFPTRTGPIGPKGDTDQRSILPSTFRGQRSQPARFPRDSASGVAGEFDDTACDRGQCGQPARFPGDSASGVAGEFDDAAGEFDDAARRDQPPRGHDTDADGPSISVAKICNSRALMGPAVAFAPPHKNPCLIANSRPLAPTLTSD